MTAAPKGASAQHSNGGRATFKKKGEKADVIDMIEILTSESDSEMPIKPTAASKDNVSISGTDEEEDDAIERRNRD